MNPGRFISFEGIEGCGKSTQLRLLAERLRAAGLQVLCVREPGGTPVGDRIRAVLLDPDLSSMTDVSEMLLFAASRAQLLRELVLPALQRGEVVLCDRYVHSSLVYQGIGRGLGRDRVWRANLPATEGLLPDRVVLLDLEPALALERVKARAGLDRIEAEALDFHTRVRDGFQQEAAGDPSRFVCVGAADAPEDVHLRVVAALTPIFAELGVSP